MKILASNIHALKILQTLFANAAPVKAFRDGGEGGYTSNSHFFPKSNFAKTHHLSLYQKFFSRDFHKITIESAAHPA
jgi:hypothetical protein